jgi:hypothetical protein
LIKTRADLEHETKRLTQDLHDLDEQLGISPSLSPFGPLVSPTQPTTSSNLSQYFDQIDVKLLNELNNNANSNNAPSRAVLKVRKNVVHPYSPRKPSKLAQSISMCDGSENVVQQSPQVSHRSVHQDSVDCLVDGIHKLMTPLVAQSPASSIVSSPISPQLLDDDDDQPRNSSSNPGSWGQPVTLSLPSTSSVVTPRKKLSFNESSPGNQSLWYDDFDGPMLSDVSMSAAILSNDYDDDDDI